MGDDLFSTLIDIGLLIGFIFLVRKYIRPLIQKQLGEVEAGGIQGGESSHPTSVDAWQRYLDDSVFANRDDSTAKTWRTYMDDLVFSYQMEKNKHGRERFFVSVGQYAPGCNFYTRFLVGVHIVEIEIDNLGLDGEYQAIVGDKSDAEELIAHWQELVTQGVPVEQLLEHTQLTEEDE